MKAALATLIGLAVCFFLEPPAIAVLALGLMVGCVAAFSDVAFPTARKTYVPPVNRPRPMTARVQMVRVVGGIALGLVMIAFALWNPLPQRWLQLAVAYTGALWIGVALVQLFTAERVRESHNAWLARITASSPLDLR